MSLRSLEVLGSLRRLPSMFYGKVCHGNGTDRQSGHRGEGGCVETCDNPGDLVLWNRDFSTVLGENSVKSLHISVGQGLCRTQRVKNGVW